MKILYKGTGDPIPIFNSALDRIIHGDVALINKNFTAFINKAILDLHCKRIRTVYA